MNKQKGAISTSAAIGIVVVILILIGIAYWYSTNNPASLSQTNTEASSTPQAGGTSNTSLVISKATGSKIYTNFLYDYIIEFPADAQNSISNPANVTFGYKSGTNTPEATLKITVNIDVTHLAFCLTVPQGAAHVATTTINGAKFLSYVVSGSATANTGTTYYRSLLTDAPYGNKCYDIQKSPQGSASLNAKLNGILQSFTFATF